MDIEYLIKGILIGFSVAAPVGPIGVLTINRTLTQGRIQGFATGMGAALADTVYGIIAGFGLTIVSSFLMKQEFLMKLIGGFFLVYLGVKSFLSKPAKEEAKINSNGVINNLVSTFFLTITNPATILAFLGIFAGLGLGSQKQSYGDSMTLVMGVFLGSALWWLFLSTIVSFFKSKVTEIHLTWINKLSGLIIVSFGIWALLSII